MQCQSLLQGCGNPAANCTNAPRELQQQHVTALLRPRLPPAPRCPAAAGAAADILHGQTASAPPSSACAQTGQTVLQYKTLLRQAGAPRVGAGAMLAGFYQVTSPGYT